MKKSFFLAIFITINFCFAQDNDAKVKLDELAKTKEGLTETVRIDVSGLTLYDFLTLIAEEHKLNLSADTSLNELVNSNFHDVVVKDVLLFLLQKYNLEMDVVNSILVFKRKPEKVEEPIIATVKPIEVSYNAQSDHLSVKLQNDSLPRVAQAITDASGKNIVLSPDVKTHKVSAYILNRPFDMVLEMMSKSNGLVLSIDQNGFYYLDKEVINVDQPAIARPNSRRRSTGNQSADEGSFETEIDSQGFLNIKAYNADAAALINEITEKLKVNYIMYNVPEGVKVTLIANNITFDDLLEHALKGKKYTYKKIEGIYLIGEHNSQGLRGTELVQLKNRTVDGVLEALPRTIIENLEIKVFIELNGFVVSGSKVNINEFKNYLLEIDKVVPVIQIEVLIVQYKKSYEIQTGLQALLSDEQVKTSGVLFPNTDVTLNSGSINKLIDAFNGLGWINLGRVTNEFYANLSALENNSIIKISSTPKLVTLNGHEATSSIGETNYYFEQNNRLINTGITDNILQSGVWKSTDANLSINIKPFVSTGEDVTLTIGVEKSSFLGRAGENAPPGKATQKFQSIVRVKNNEMVLLGGLDELENGNSGTGAPLLSRIPVLKWFFSSRTKKKEKSKLHIFIKPTVIY